MIRRRRYCPGCGKRWTTYEVTAEAYEEMQRAAVSLRHIREVLNGAAEA